MNDERGIKTDSSFIVSRSSFSFGVVQLAGRLTLNQEIEVQILSPKPIFWAFRRWLYGRVLETRVRRFESCRPDQTQSEIWDFGFRILYADVV
jgi:hypothetical protein